MASVTWFGSCLFWNWAQMTGWLCATGMCKCTTTTIQTHTHTHSFLKHLFVSGGCIMIPWQPVRHHMKLIPCSQSSPHSLYTIVPWWLRSWSILLCDNMLQYPNKDKEKYRSQMEASLMSVKHCHSWFCVQKLVSFRSVRSSFAKRAIKLLTCRAGHIRRMFLPTGKPFNLTGTAFKTLLNDCKVSTRYEM